MLRIDAGLALRSASGGNFAAVLGRIAMLILFALLLAAAIGLALLLAYR
jgi:hypothetical protein